MHEENQSYLIQLVSVRLNFAKKRSVVCADKTFSLITDKFQDLLDTWQASVIKGNAGELAALVGSNEVSESQCLVLRYR